MAVIQKIRNKYGKLAGAVIAIALVGFILMDAASGRFGDMFGHDSSVMKIDGEKIDQKTYQERLKEYETLYNIYNGRGRNVDDNTRAHNDEQAVQFLVYEKVAGKMCDKLGLQTTKDEENELIYGPNAEQLVQQFQLQGQPVFINPDTHRFDPQYVKGFEKQANEIDPTGKALESWEAVKEYIRRSNKINKFSNAVVAGIYYPKYLAQRKLKDEQSMASIRYVKVPYTSVNDNEIGKVTDEDLKAYMNKHSGLFHNDEETRNIEYVTFDIKPSHDDTAKVLDALNKLKSEFTATKDNESFVKRNTDGKYDSSFVNKKDFQSVFADSILNQPVGVVYGPYYENGAYRMAKITERKELPDTVKCRHILVITQNRRQDVRSDSAAKMRIDSAVALIKAGMPFDSVVNKYSDDGGSLKTGGEYTYSLMQRPGISKEFGDFIFDGKPGESKIVKVENDGYSGYHYIEILDQKDIQPAERLAIVSKELFPGNRTVDSVYAKANEFAGKNSTSSAFDAAIKAQNLDRKQADHLKVTDYAIKGLGAAREVIKWAYSQKPGDVSPVFQLENGDRNNRYLIAKLKSVQPKGMTELDETIRPLVENAVKNDKKMEFIANKYKSMNSLESIGQATSQPVQNADSISFGAPYIPSIGYAPKLIGYTFYDGNKPGTVTPGIKGADGVYFENVTTRWNAPANPATDVNRERMSDQAEMINSLGQAIQQSLVRTAKIEYHPANM